MAAGVTWSTLYLGQLADMDTDESTLAKENPNALIGTYGSASDPISRSIVDVTTDSTDGDDTISADNFGTSDTLSYDLGAGLVTQQLDSAALANVTVTFEDGSVATGNVAIFQDDAGNAFMAIGDSQGLLGSQPIDSVQVNAVSSRSYTGMNQTTRDDLEFVCFGLGTLIATPGGERRVEDLSVGDLVETLDRGPQPIRWIGRRTLRFTRAAHRSKPILFPAGALGNGRPRRDLIVSPQHRILLRGGDVWACAGEAEALGAAKGFVAWPKVRQLKGCREITYLTLLFDRHEVIRAEGVALESFFPGPQGMTLLSAEEREEVYALHPALRADPDHGYGRRARPFLKPREVRVLLAHRRRERAPLERMPARPELGSGSVGAARG
ncbi:MAG: Hint domain-containing protein [Pseudomonadota bacterium]